jgi:ArsR family transcriptional regulator
MGISKTEHFTDRQNKLANIAKALGHPARIAIIDYLIKAQECICGDIVNILPLAQPTISQHLKELKSAGILQGTIGGNSITYSINKDVLQILKDYCEIAIIARQSQAVNN